MDIREKPLPPKNKVFPCPHCGKAMVISVRTEIQEVSALEDGNVNWEHGLSEDQKKLFAEVKEGSLFSMFVNAVQIAKANQIPKSCERFFLGFLPSCAQKSTPGFILNYFRKELTGRIEFFAGNGVCAVTTDGHVRAFIPQSFIVSRTGEGLTRNLDIEDVKRWFDGNTIVNQDPRYRLNRMKSLAQNTRPGSTRSV